MTEHDARTVSNLTAAAIFSELQPRLMENPFATHPTPAMKQEKAFRRGFRRGLGQALSWVSVACRSGREMDAVVADIQIDTARRVLEYLQPVIPAGWADDAARRFGVENLYVADPTESVAP